ncbi:hypothetical protein [Kitasatospora aureofaciens]
MTANRFQRRGPKSKNPLGAMVREMSGDTPSGTLMSSLDTGLNQRAP